MDLPNQYQGKETEEKWRAHWENKQYFASKPDEREPYTILIPPPNVTGFLHMGHMLNNTIQDVLIRKARLEGKNACWVPGTDHASIATESKVVALLRERGLSKEKIGREAFLKEAFAWKEKYGGIILEQLKRLGASCDWSRTRFTMEESMSRAVRKVFVDLYRKGYVYRGLRMTNWDPEALTALSNEEVIYEEEQSQLYYINYPIEGLEASYLCIATTRPETILADVALAVHPEDARYAALHGKRVRVPLTNRWIPIIADAYVDKEFGTGALKITPAHDLNDYELGKRYDLPVIEILDERGRLTEAAGLYVGQDRFWVRKQIAKDLKAQGYLAKVEAYKNKVGRSERSKAVVEPRLTEQWFVRMEDLAAKALAAVESGEVRFFPPDFINMYRTWLQPTQVRDWCISRQLWWGQRIPAFYGLEGEVYVAETLEEALVLARAAGKAYELGDLRQDEDVVDTWFSSWLWPLTVFDAFDNAEEFKYYYPTNVLVTGWDIMFFWVARMVMVGYEWGGELLGEDLALKKGVFPFKDVYFTGMVRDKKRRKMSKSLGNSPDALVLLEKYGADGVRFGMLACSSAGKDVIFDAPFEGRTEQIVNESELCEQGRNFCNKLWNALRLLRGWEVLDREPTAERVLALRWLEARFEQVLGELEEKYQTYRLSDILMSLYNFIWGDFCSWYLEWIKPPYGEGIDRVTYEGTISLFERMMVVLHPYMPFITEEVWSLLRVRGEGEDCVVAAYPRVGFVGVDLNLLERVAYLHEAVVRIRELRSKHRLSPKEALALRLGSGDLAEALRGLAGWSESLVKLAAVVWSEEVSQAAVSFLAGPVQFFIELPLRGNPEEERAKLEEERRYLEGFLASVEKKLSNERFVQNAKAEVVALERKKQQDAQTKLRLLEEELARLV